MPNQGFVVATDDVVAELIRNASHRLMVVAPAVSDDVGAAVRDRLKTLDPENVTVVLDSDPEVYRLGYGSAAALEELCKVATAVGASVARQPGLRIGLVIADERTLIFSPTAAVVEAGPNTTGGANGMILERPPKSVEAAVGLSDKSERQVGRTKMDAHNLANISKDLKDNPPQRFDVARRVRVFNAFIEFIELEVTGTELSRRTVPIPSHLLAVSDPQTQEQLRATFRLMPPKDGLSSDDVERHRRLIARQYFRLIPRYGTVILRRDKERLIKELEALEATVAAFAKRVQEGVEQSIEENRKELVRALLPALTLKPPRQWIPPHGQLPDQETIARYLEQDLSAAFGSADRLIREMRVQWRFKGVTYELLGDSAFLEGAMSRIPELARFHEEFDAAPSTAGDLREREAAS